MRDPSPLERSFMTRWLQLGDLSFPMHREYYFDPRRKWQFDLAVPDVGVAIELEGGVYTGGRHTRGSGFEKDCEKYNAAADRGWLVLRYTSRMLNKDAIGVIEQINRILQNRRILLHGHDTSGFRIEQDRSAKRKRAGAGAGRRTRPVPR